jgi:outer membrane protein assembly factor BamB
VLSSGLDGNASSSVFRTTDSSILGLLIVVSVLSGCAINESASTNAGQDGTTISSATAQSQEPAKEESGDWPRFGFDPARSGVNPENSPITPSTVNSLHRLWHTNLPRVTDSSPILLHGLGFSDKTRDTLYVTTREGQLVALDAADGTILWSRQPSEPKTTNPSPHATSSITNSSPVADPSRQYIYSYGLDGSLHKYAAITGEEVQEGSWPTQITRMPETEKESSALNITSERIYAATSGYFGDAPPYQGHVVSVDSSSGEEDVFNSLCSDVRQKLSKGECLSDEAGIWARGGAVIDSETGEVFVTSGNGPYDADKGGHNYGDSILKLSPDGLNLLDSYTPKTYQQLEDTDADLGSTAPALLPRIAESKTPLLLVQGGKDRQLRLINREDMSGAGGAGHVGGELQQTAAAGCGTFTQPVVWTDTDNHVWVVVAGTCGIGAYQVITDDAGTPSLNLVWQTSDKTTSPVLSGGVLFAATNGSALALDPSTGRQLWSSTEGNAEGTIGNIHWESPIVAGGKLYISDESGTISAYGLQ